MSSSNSVEGRNLLPDLEQFQMMNSSNSVEGRNHLPESEQFRMISSSNSVEGQNHLPDSKQFRMVSSSSSVEGRNNLLKPEQVQTLSSSIRVLSENQTADREREPSQRRGHKRQARILNSGVTRMENVSDEGAVRERGEEGVNGQREKRNEFHWRRPKTQFVTNTYRMTPPSSRFQLPGLQSWSRNNRRYLADNDQVRRSGGPTQRRIIYYATLPEIVRPPTAKSMAAPPVTPRCGLTATSPLHQHSTRQAATNYGDTNRPNINLNPNPNLNVNPNPPPKDNEIIHVSSAVIDVTNNRDQPASPTAILTTSAIQQNGAQNGGHRIYDITPQNGAQSGAHRNTIYDITPQNGGHRIYDVTSQNGAQSGAHRNTIYDITPQNGAQHGGHRIYDVSPQQKYTIYDMEPPYMRNPYYNNYYNLDNKLLGYDKQRYSYYYQQYQPLGQYPPNQDRFYNDVRTPPYRVHAPYQNELPPYKYPYQNMLPPYQSPPLYYDRKPEYVPIEIQTTAPSVSSSTTSTTTTEATPKGVGDPRHQPSSTAESASDLSKQGNSTNGLVSRYV
ncbi:uncharacterized protein LOC111054884 [Nilaparvata lugens]|uniref:uncharacterized protein LOC111054884 n=1 Tax=Nilaparvata lugens TaxID=108931 RepID=UPI00193E09BD|nr:uncharacterized protein LOC111054884 [Nilaparvata lugens]